jgi:hypothetical protein
MTSYQVPQKISGASKQHNYPLGLTLFFAQVAGQSIHDVAHRIQRKIKRVQQPASPAR